MGAYEDLGSTKATNVFVKVAGHRGVSCIVAEVGWAESMEDDAYLTLRDRRAN